ncbi:MAG: hypothetical protein U0003_02970 [Vampirovibrionales bacterium]
MSTPSYPTPPSFSALVDELALITGQILALVPQHDWPRMNQLLHQRDALLARLHYQKPATPVEPAVMSTLETVSQKEDALQKALLNQMAQVQQACQLLKTRRQQVGRYRCENPASHHTRAQA